MTGCAAMPPKPPSLKIRALQWLAQREHSREELKRKLLRLAARRDDDAPDPEPEVDALLDWLVAGGHLSQARFVESRVHARQQRYGNLRIAQELQHHGAAIDAQTRGELEGSEFDRALSVWGKKFGSSAADAAGRVRQTRFLSGRGFTPEVVRRVLREAAAREAASREAASREVVREAAASETAAPDAAAPDAAAPDAVASEPTAPAAGRPEGAEREG